MSTRLYYSPVETGITVAADAGWAHPPESRRQADGPNVIDSFLLSQVPLASPLAGIRDLDSETATVHGGSHTYPAAPTGYNMGSARFVSPPIDAITFTGKFKSMAHCYGQFGVTNVSPNISVRVVSGDGSTVRGTLFAPFTNTTIPYEVSSSGSNRVAKFPGTWDHSGSPDGIDYDGSVVAQAGDRICVELGVRIYPTGSNTIEYYNIVLPRGDLTSTDMVTSQINSSAASDHYPWIEFSEDLVFLSVEPFALSLGPLPL